MDELKRIQNVYEKRMDSAIVDRYSLFRPGELYGLQQREKTTLKMLRRAGWNSLRGRSILEIGCGRGHRLADFQRWGADSTCLHGIDLMSAFVRDAKQHFPNYTISQSSGHQLPYRDASFDLVMQSTVFTSINDVSLRQQIAKEMLRVVKPNGIIIWYDFRYPNPRNADVFPLSQGDIRALFPNTSCTLSSLTLLPPLARKIAQYSFLACQLLELFPPLRSHYLGVIQKK